MRRVSPLTAAAAAAALFSVCAAPARAALIVPALSSRPDADAVLFLDFDGVDYGTSTWADAHLNEQGIEQGKALSQFWTDAIENDGIPLPDSIYTSPLSRALETTRLAFAPVMQQHSRPFRPIVKEALRERLTAHTCDRRSNRSWMTENYPECIIEDGFTMEDELWRSDWVETAAEHRTRAQGFLEELFEGDGSTFVALTVHSYAVSAVLEAVGMPGFRVSEGSVVAVLVRGQRVCET